MVDFLTGRVDFLTQTVKQNMVDLVDLVDFPPIFAQQNQLYQLYQPSVWGG